MRKGKPFSKNIFDDFDFDETERCDDPDCEICSFDVQPKENNMTNTELDIRDQKRYFESRMWSIYGSKEKEAERFFGICDDEPPKTTREAYMRIVSGNFTFPPEEYDCDGVHGFRWKNPLKIPDKEGHKVVHTKLDKAQQKCIDQIMIGQPRAMKEAVKTFEKVTIH